MFALVNVSVSPLWRRALIFWLPPIVYAAAIFHFSAETNPLPTLTTTIWDKALHIVEYAGLAVLVARALRREGFGRGWSLTLALAIASAYGASDEWHQIFVPGRDSNVLDWVADTIGAAIGAMLYSVGSR